MKKCNKCEAWDSTKERSVWTGRLGEEDLDLPGREKFPECQDRRASINTAEGIKSNAFAFSSFCAINNEMDLLSLF